LAHIPCLSAAPNTFDDSAQRSMEIFMTTLCLMMILNSWETPKLLPLGQMKLEFLFQIR
jgi:hypothetical protein